MLRSAHHHDTQRPAASPLNGRTAALTVSGVHPVDLDAGKAVARAALVASGLTQRALAASMPIDPSLLSRKLDADEAEQFTLRDVLRAHPRFIAEVAARLTAIAAEREAPIATPLPVLVGNACKEHGEAHAAVLRGAPVAEALRELAEADAADRALARALISSNA